MNGGSAVASTLVTAIVLVLIRFTAPRLFRV
nr:hypothetical protein [Lacticaseibacillus sharpeae]